MSAGPPTLSVIVPLPDDARDATETFAALAASDLPRHRWELIVVATTQPRAMLELAAEFADAIVRVGAQRTGSAFLCNRGAEVARGSVLVFFDRDVAVEHDTLSRIDDAFDDPELTAIAGTVVPALPTAPVPTRYRALARQWAFQRSAGLSEHFATCCGAIRAPAFHASGRLDEWRCPAVGSAAVELGLRLRAEGRRIEVRDDVRVISRRRAGWLGAARPLMILSSPPPWMPDHSDGPAVPLRRLRARERILAAGLWLSVLLALGGIEKASANLSSGAALIAFVVLLADLPLLAHVARGGGIIVLCAALPLRVVSLLATGARVVFDAVRFRVLGAPHPAPGVEALAEVGARHWPPDAN